MNFIGCWAMEDKIICWNMICLQKAKSKKIYYYPSNSSYMITNEFTIIRGTAEIKQTYIRHR